MEFVLLTALVTSLIILGVVQGRVIHLAADGRDTETCGSSQSAACLTLTKSLKVTSDGDEIVVHQPPGDERSKSWLCEEDPLRVDRSLTIRGGGDSLVRIGCPVMNPRILMMMLDGRWNTTIRFTNINLTGSMLQVYRGQVHFQTCHIHDVSWVSDENATYVSLTVTDTKWFSRNDFAYKHFMNATGKEQEIFADVIKIFFYNSHFYDSKMKMYGGMLDIRIENCFFDGWLQYMSSPQGGLEIFIGLPMSNSVVAVRNTTFANQYYHYPIQSIQNLYEASIYIRVNDISASNCNVVVELCKFVNNERALTFFGPFNHINITETIFQSNIAMHAGAGILYLMYGQSFITNCLFDSNAAGAFREDLVLSYEDSFQIRGDEVRIQSDCCDGVISFMGKGGGLRVQRGVVHLEGVTFRNNTARLLGGALFVDRVSNVTVQNVQFENSPEKVHSLQGDLVYSNGRLWVENARLLVLTAENHVDVLRHSGNHWSIEVQNVSVQCPVGYRLRVTNTSAYGITPIGLKRSHHLDQLSYFCESCPRNRYSLDYGYMNYSLVYSSDMYFTLLINGDTPVQSYSGTYDYHDIECLPCPYGGKCQHGIVAVANFWGYIVEDKVQFQHCPKGYCCSSTDCKKHNTCAKHRTGELCGHCEEGYSEALFSSQCIPDELCDSTWLYPVAFGSGVLYALFLLFQKDIRDMMFMKTVKLKDIRGLRHNTKSKPQESTHSVVDPLRAAFYSEPPELEVLHVSDDTEGHPDENGVVKNNNEKSSLTGECIDDTDAPNDPPVDTGASFLIILFYYFQDAQLLHIKTVFASSENKSMSMLKEILSGLFKFRIELFQFMDKLCFLAGISPTFKLLIQVLLVPYVLLQFCIVYFVYRWWQRIRRRQIGRNSKQADNEANNSTQDFSRRLATGFVLALLFTYQKLATTSFTLLNCVPIGETSVLFIQGTVSCYQVWQYGVIAYAVSCITPFFLVLLIGPGLLQDGLISLPQFFCACIVPLPFLFYWIVIRLRLQGKRPNANEELSNESKAVINILQGPFKEAYSETFGPICGQGVLIARRLILVVLFTFVNDTLIRMLCMMLVCFIILLHHLHVLPYKDKRGNLAGTVSAAALVLVGGINLVRAGFESAEYVPQGPNKILMAVFEEMENVLMLWFPAAVMSLVLVSLTVKLLLRAARRVMSSPADRHTASRDDKL